MYTQRCEREMYPARTLGPRCSDVESDIYTEINGYTET